MIQEESRCDFIIILIKKLFKMGMGLGSGSNGAQS